MPDTGGRKRRGLPAWTLSKAHDAGELALVRCRLCNVKRWYDPNDLLKLFGDVEAAAIDGKMFCVKCGKKEYISAEFQHLSAKERMGVRVRRLAEIRTVRRIIWKDEC